MKEAAKVNEIFKILEEDARKTPEQIAIMTGLPVAESNRTILKYKAVINWDKLGDDQVQALVEVRVTPQRDVGFDAIAERIYRFPEARTVYLLSGTYELLVLTTGKTMHEVAAFTSNKLATIEGVQGTVTHFLLKRYKEDGEILSGDERRKKREPFML
jgi:DNA-binding Lrp family transcriptional regulator